jgi:16S rRNA (uracil1498-N3)-methyltransferase
MSAPVFWAPSAAFEVGDSLLLDGAEGRHAVTVRRLRPGEAVEVTDGQGRAIIGAVAGLRPPDQCLVAIHHRLTVAQPLPRLVVVQAIPKGDRAEAAVALMTEVGVDEIIPWQAARCVVRWDGDRASKALRRWRTTATESGKQSRRRWFPTVSEPATGPDVVARIAAAQAALVLHEGAEAPLGAWSPPTSGEIVMVIGPEGGIADDELRAFSAAGAAVVHAGPSVMRSATAGAAAAAVVLARAGRWDAARS